MNPLLPMIPSDLDAEMASARSMDMLALYDAMKAALATVAVVLPTTQCLALWARIGIFGTELEKRCAQEFGEENPTPGPWREAHREHPDADETVLGVHTRDCAYAIAVFEPSEDQRTGAWLDAATFQPVAITHWLPLIGILEPPTHQE